MFFKRNNNPETPSALKIKIPMIPSEDLVGNLGAPLRSTSISVSRTSPASGSTRPRESRVSADPLLDWNADDDDDEELEDIEITSSRPMLVGLEIDPNGVGEGSGSPLWRKEFDRVGVEEVTSLMSRNAKAVAARTTVRSTYSPPMVDTESLLPSRQPSKSTVEEGALLVDVDWDLDSPLRYPPRASIASTVNSDPREVIPRRLSYFA